MLILKAGMTIKIETLQQICKRKTDLNKNDVCLNRNTQSRVHGDHVCYYTTSILTSLDLERLECYTLQSPDLRIGFLNQI